MDLHRVTLFLKTHRETDRVFTVSGVQLGQSNWGLFHYHHTVFSSQVKSKCGNILVKTVGLRIILNIDGVPVVSRSHTYPSVPSHSQTSRLLTSSLSLGVPVPRTTQCMWDVQIPQLQLVVFHHTDTHMYVFFLSLTLSINNKPKEPSVCDVCRSLSFSL
jgi:hypothetical protein